MHAISLLNIPKPVLFKGKRKNGEWVYGYLTFFNDKTAYIADDGIVLYGTEDECKGDDLGGGCEEYTIGNLYQVRPETVCMATGFRDRNYTEIYEYDILLYEGEETHQKRYGVVLANYRGCFSIVWCRDYDAVLRLAGKIVKKLQNPVEFRASGSVIYGDEVEDETIGLVIDAKKSTIIGSIFDIV